MTTEIPEEDSFAKRHVQELEDLEHRCTAHLEHARAGGSKGKKAKAAVEEAEREAEQWRYDLCSRHQAEADEAEGPPVVSPSVDESSVERRAGAACAAGTPTPRTKKGGKKRLTTGSLAAGNDALEDRARPKAASTRSWYEDSLGVEDMAPPDPVCVSEAEGEDEPEIIPDIKPHSAEVRGNVAMVSLLGQSKELSEDCFYEDCTEGCSKRGGWRLTLLASGMAKGNEATLLGFLVYRLKPDLQMPVLSVSKLAVPESFRRRGYGRKLIVWATQYAKSLPNMQCIGLSSLPDAVPFYQRLGFKSMHVITAKTDVAEADDDLIPGQIYMEYKIKRAGGPRKSR